MKKIPYVVATPPDIAPPIAVGAATGAAEMLVSGASEVLVWAGESPGAKMSPAAMTAAMPAEANGFFMEMPFR